MGHEEASAINGCYSDSETKYYIILVLGEYSLANSIHRIAQTLDVLRLVVLRQNLEILDHADIPQRSIHARPALF